MKRRIKQYLTGFIPGLIIFTLNTSCASAPGGLSQFEQFSSAFLEETRKAEENTMGFTSLVKDLSDYENRIGTLSNSEYKDVEKKTAEILNAKNKMESQIESAKRTGRSVTPDGYYADTKKEVHGWDAAAYTNLHIETALDALDQNYARSISGYKNIDFLLLAAPDKPFNNTITNLLTGVKIDIASAKSAVSAKDWNSAKDNADHANTALKSALKLDLNTIERYRAGLLQNDLKDVSRQITLGSAANTAGSLLKTVGEGAAKIINGIGDRVNR